MMPRDLHAWMAATQTTDYSMSGLAYHGDRPTYLNTEKEEVKVETQA